MAAKMAYAAQLGAAARTARKMVRQSTGLELGIWVQKYPAEVRCEAGSLPAALVAVATGCQYVRAGISARLLHLAVRGARTVVRCSASGSARFKPERAEGSRPALVLLLARAELRG